MKRPFSVNVLPDLPHSRSWEAHRLRPATFDAELHPIAGGGEDLEGLGLSQVEGVVVHVHELVEPKKRPEIHALRPVLVAISKQNRPF